jgi:small-conductance mechanosensitive channel
VLERENATIRDELRALEQANAALRERVGVLEQANVTLRERVGVLEQANAALRERVGVLEQQPPRPAPYVRIVFDVCCLTDECAAITQEMDVTEVVALRNDLQRVQEQLQVQQYSVCKLVYSIISLMRRMYKSSFPMKGGKERLQRYVPSHMLCTCVCTFAVLVGSAARAYRGAGSSKQCSCGLFLRG